ncbi:hypothetical protein YC2023_007558 [Brassica napus]
MIKNTPEWEVRVTNPCTCTGIDIVLTCVGLKSLTPIDHSQISISGNECLDKAVRSRISSLRSWAFASILKPWKYSFQ